MILFLSNRRLFTIKYSFLWIMYIDINCQNMDKFTDTKMTNLWCFKERVPADLILIKCSKNRYLNDPPVCIWICCRDWSIIFYIICVARIKVEVASWNKMLAVTWPEMGSCCREAKHVQIMSNVSISINNNANLLLLQHRRLPTTSVTRLGDFLHFGQLFQAFGNN